MKQILVLPKFIFDSNFSNDKFLKYDYACFISILDCDNTEERYNKSIDNFLQVKMWDIEEDVGEYKKPDDIELTKIVDFINRHSDKSVFIVHCSMGVSRSGAVGRFILEKFRDEIDYQKFNRDNSRIQPNLYIYNRLQIIDNLLKINNTFKLDN